MNKKKVCILGTANLKHMTLISLYTNEFEKEGVEYDIIYIDKYNDDEVYDGATLYKYYLELNPSWSFLRKLLKYWRFRKYAIEIINKNQYDFIVVWNEFTAFMFSDFLSKKYARRYCVNVRDQNYNSISPVQLRYKQAVGSACFSTISSERFRNLYPKSDYLFIHSFNSKLLNELKSVKEKRPIEDSIRLMFIGRMSYPESIYKIIKSLGNDSRFEVWLIGAGCEIFRNTVEENGLSNIIIQDSFKPSETVKFLENADIIYSLNKENDVHSDTLLPIKLYYAIGKHIPILTYKSSYTFEYAKNHNIGIGITSADFDKLGDLIFDKYTEMKQSDIKAGCINAMKEIENTHNILKERIQQYIIN